MKSFDIPVIYKSPLISAVKGFRKAKDPMKKDFQPTMLDFGPIQILLARHFGFCYGVENAIEIAFRTLDEYPDKRIFLLSEMIHNPHVNKDLQDRGVRFIMDTSGKQLIPWEDIHSDDIVIIPAFGTTLSIESKLQDIGLNPRSFNTTCPFVERVWNKAASIGDKAYTVIIHGKPTHEETRATFSHSQNHTPTVVVRNLKEAELLAAYIRKERPAEQFFKDFDGQYSEGFDPTRDLEHIGVVNQTTMLAGETQEIADSLRQTMIETYHLEGAAIRDRFADTRDTLCYATNDNQSAILEMLQESADLALVVGGYNSSNTSHLVELLESKFPTYYISSEQELLSTATIRHSQWRTGHIQQTEGYLPDKEPIRILISSGASCPDALVESVIRRLLEFYDLQDKMEEMVDYFTSVLDRPKESDEVR